MKKIAGLAIIALAICLIIFGGQKWLHTRDVNAVVDQFFTAMIDGDGTSAQKMLSPSLQQRKGPLTLSPEPGLTYSIHQTKLFRTTAVVNVLIEKQGFVLKPIVHLEKSSTNRWQITKIENLVEDPMWQDMQKELARQHDNQLAKQLQQAFAKQEGASVKHQE